MIHSKHQRLVLNCYPPGRDVEKKPNASDLSYLLYYASSRRVKLLKVAPFVEKLARSDIAKTRPGNAMVSLDIFKALTDVCYADLDKFAENIMNVLNDTLQSNDLSLCRRAAPLWASFCQHYSRELLTGKPEFALVFKQVLTRYCNTASATESQLRASGNAVNLQEWHLVGISALNAFASSSAISSTVGQQQVATIVPILLQYLTPQSLKQLERISTSTSARSEAVSPPSSKTVSQAPTTHDIAALSFKTLTALVETTSGNQLSDCLNAIVDFLFNQKNPLGGSPNSGGGSGFATPPDTQDHLQPPQLSTASRRLAAKSIESLRARQSQRNSRIETHPSIFAQRNSFLALSPDEMYEAYPVSTSNVGNLEWTATLLQCLSKYIPVQFRFAIVVVLAKIHSKLLPSEHAKLEFTVDLMYRMLCSSVSMVGLSVIDVLRLLLESQHSSIKFGQSGAANTNKTDVIVEKIERCIGALSYHVYYGDQIQNLVQEILNHCTLPHLSLGSNQYSTSASLSISDVGVGSVAQSLGPQNDGQRRVSSSASRKFDRQARREARKERVAGVKEQIRQQREERAKRRQNLRDKIRGNGHVSSETVQVDDPDSDGNYSDVDDDNEVNANVNDRIIDGPRAFSSGSGLAVQQSFDSSETLDPQTLIAYLNDIAAIINFPYHTQSLRVRPIAFSAWDESMHLLSHENEEVRLTFISGFLDYLKSNLVPESEKVFSPRSLYQSYGSTVMNPFQSTIGRLMLEVYNLAIIPPDNTKLLAHFQSLQLLVVGCIRTLHSEGAIRSFAVLLMLDKLSSDLLQSTNAKVHTEQEVKSSLMSSAASKSQVSLLHKHQDEENLVVHLLSISSLALIGLYEAAKVLKMDELLHISKREITERQKNQVWIPLSGSSEKERDVSPHVSQPLDIKDNLSMILPIPVESYTNCDIYLNETEKLPEKEKQIMRYEVVASLVLGTPFSEEIGSARAQECLPSLPDYAISQQIVRAVTGSTKFGLPTVQTSSDSVGVANSFMMRPMNGETRSQMMEMYGMEMNVPPALGTIRNGSIRSNNSNISAPRVSELKRLASSSSAPSQRAESLRDALLGRTTSLSPLNRDVESSNSEEKAEFDFEDKNDLSTFISNMTINNNGRVTLV